MRDIAFGRIASVCLFVIAASFAPPDLAFAATLVLQDGSVIHGEIESLQRDVYTVKTDALGTVRVRKQDIRTIDHSAVPAVRSSAESSSNSSLIGQAEVQALQSRMLQNPNLLSMIQALQSDPEVQAVLADPEIISAMASGDYAALMIHPKIVALSGNTKLRELIDQVQ